MEQSDKILLGIGGFLLVVGGVILLKKNQSANDTIADGSQFIDQPAQTNTTTPVKTSAPVKSAPSKISAVIPDGFSYRVGQRIMSNVRPNVVAQDVQKDAAGQYYTNGTNVIRFPYGQEIGVIKWIGKRPDGTFRYVVERKELGGLFSSLYWVNHKHVKPVGEIIPPKPTVRDTSGLNMELLLHRGLYNSPEVKELQKRLGVAADGDFGQNTENALFAKKKVTQIKLKDF